MTQQEKHDSSSRIGIIEAVQKPINFFALTVLVVEVLLGITANFSQGTDRTYLVIGMITLIFALVFIVAGFALFRPEALTGQRPITEAQIQDNDIALPPSVKILNKPSLLMVASGKPFTTYLDSDVKVVEEFFTKQQIKICKDITTTELKDILTDKQYDIVHLIAKVDNDESLIFSDTDRLSPEALSKLVEETGTSLVVLAVCDSVKLAAIISRSTNMIAAIETVIDKDVLEWERLFYKLLSRGQSLSRAYEMARATTSPQMVLLMKRDFAIASDAK